MIAAMAWLLAAFGCASEAYHEKDWPRHTFGYFAAASAVLIVCIFVFV